MMHEDGPAGQAIEFASLRVSQQPDDVSCGPTCLQAVYSYHGLELSVAELIASVQRLDHGGSLGVLLGLDALARGFTATLYTYNLSLFDPTWFHGSGLDVYAALSERYAHRVGMPRSDPTRAYLEFLERGGEVRHRELTADFLRGVLAEDVPPITALSATYLYDCAREVYEGRRARYDAIHGEPVGHFVIVSGYDSARGTFRISDPSQDNPRHGSGEYWVSAERLLGAILLGVSTMDGNLLLVRPVEAAEMGSPHA